MKTYFDRIISEIIEDPYFEKFRFRKRDSSLIHKTQYGREIIHMEHWSYFNISLTIRPYYGVRYDKLCKWFEKFSFKTIADQRNGDYVGFDGDMLGKQQMYEFPYYEPEPLFATELKRMKDDIIECSKYVFEEYDTLEKAYQKNIIPILEGNQNLPRVGADWFFENLTLCKITHPEKYKELKEIHLRHAAEMNRRGELNMSEYYPRLDEILSFMENQNL